ncbi:MAG: phospho-N-acetylmuramoyl-pentapeptide-transferase [Clostridiales bacterium]|nr:phospho-N-acetylmuramoyl-pentapeptide-transferase [Clostridiales bacterium]
MNTTVGIILAVAIAFVITAALGFVMIPWLHKLKFGQTILDIGPSWHKKKQGTPTMGGIMFVIGITVAVAVVFITDKLLGSKLMQTELGISLNQNMAKLWGGFFMAFGFAVIGFIDDYIKVAKKRNLGLTIKQKTFMQLALSLAYIFCLYSQGCTYTVIPFVSGKIDLGIWFVLLALCVIYGAINAVNFTDGIDGLCTSVTFTAAIAFIVIAALQKFAGVSILAAALAGGCVGFLVWNWHPAKVFMGDTGSLFMGGLIVALAFGVDCPIILLPVGIIYVIEAMSDVIQIGYFKLTHGKRIFKMAPIHHHFEMSGWSEVKIVVVFSIINIIGSIAGILLVYYGVVVFNK